jgi:hypothetical protein
MALEPLGGAAEWLAVAGWASTYARSLDQNERSPGLRELNRVKGMCASVGVMAGASCSSDPSMEFMGLDATLRLI